MPAEVKEQIRLEVAHILFIDTVGYSKLSINEQRAVVDELTTIVRGSDQYQKAEAAGRLIKIPTGDGMALVFYTSQEAPAQCAIEISGALKVHPRLQVRMGVHSGPVSGVIDVNGHANLAGAGINMAQRVMDCGDVGHILVSKHVAEDLEEYEHWRPLLHDLGACEVKHGVRVEITNLYSEEVGNAAPPRKFQAVRKHRARLRWAQVAIALLVLGAVVAGSIFLSRRPTAAISAIPAKSIAVLPFDNLSSDKENAYFTDGVQDEILTHLAKVADLKVISRASVMQYKSGIARNLRKIGEELSVAHVVEGSVQRAGNKVRVNAQLIDARNDRHEWAENYDRPIDDAFAIQSEIAKAIAEQLNAKLSGAERKAIAEKPTQNATAYDAYLRGVAIDTAATLDTTKKVAALYADAVRLDPQFALASARLAVARSQLYFNGIDLEMNSSGAVKEAANRAMSLQPELGEAWLAQGVYRYRVLRDFQGALESYNGALRRLPNSAFVLEQMAHLERRLGQFDVAQNHYQAAAQLDPRNIGILLTLADAFHTLRRYDETSAILDRVLEMSPGNEAALSEKAFSFQVQGRLKEAAEVLAKAPANSQDQDVNVLRALQLHFERRFDEAIAYIQEKMPAEFANDPRTMVLLGYCQKFAGKDDDARATFMRAVAEMKPTPDSAVVVDARNLPCYLSWVYAGLGEKEKALEQARNAISDYENDALAKPLAEASLAIVHAQTGDIDSAISALPHLLEVPNGATIGDLQINPFWDPLRGDPRFEKIVTSLAPK